MTSTAARHARFVLLLLGMALAPACDRQTEQPAHANALLVVVDALRADRLGCYGNARPTSPNIDALAKDGTVFTNAATVAPWTLPAMGTLWTSLYPSVHGATQRSSEAAFSRNRRTFRPVSTLAESYTTLAEVLQANHVTTLAFVDGAYPSGIFGFAQGFDQFVDAETAGIRNNIELLLAALDEGRNGRFFAYLHTVEVHSPYTPPGTPPDLRRRTDELAKHYRETLPEERKRFLQFDFDPGYEGKLDGSRRSLQVLRGQHSLNDPDRRHLDALYDRGVAYTDYWLGQLIDGLKERHLYDRTTIIITADHGDELFDHGGLEHGATFYDEIMRIPLLMRVPHEGNGLVVEDQVSLIDMMPTVLDLLGIETAVDMQGVSMRPLLHGAALGERTVFAEAPMSIRGKAMRSLDFKYLYNGKRRGEKLYDLRADPGERENLCENDSSRCDAFADRMRHWEKEMEAERKRRALLPAPTAAIDKDTRERLRALGYE